jgi:hypothetical protein
MTSGSAADIPNILVELSRLTPTMHELLLSLPSFVHMRRNLFKSPLILGNETSAPENTSISAPNSKLLKSGHVYFQFEDISDTKNTTFAVGVRTGTCVVDEIGSYSLHVTTTPAAETAGNFDMIVTVVYYSDIYCKKSIGWSYLPEFLMWSGGNDTNTDDNNVSSAKGYYFSLGEELKLNFDAVILR